MQTLSVQNCPYCGAEVDVSQSHVCADCQTPHHSECWTHNGGCTTFGCRSAPSDEDKIRIDPSLISSLPQTDIYVMLNGTRLGPMSLQNVQDNIHTGVFTAQTLVWSPADPQWMELSLAMPSIFTQHPPPLPIAALSPRFAVEKTAPGLGRLTFFGCLVAVSVVSGILTMSDPGAFAGVFYIGSLVVMAFRAINIGHSAWYCLIALVPCANCFYFGYFFAVPPNYAKTKKMDTTGYVIVGVYILTFVLLVVVSAANSSNH